MGKEDTSATAATYEAEPAMPPTAHLAAFLADTRVRVTGYADDRTAPAVREA